MKLNVAYLHKQIDLLHSGKSKMIFFIQKEGILGCDCFSCDRLRSF